MKLLALSTSTMQGSAVVSDGETMLGASVYEESLEHAERLMDCIESALKNAGIGKNQIDWVACDIGPGSFTGVRVGIATAKGIAFALKRPVIGVGALVALAEVGGGTDSSNVYCVLDAKKHEYYVGMYRMHSAMHVEIQTEAQLIEKVKEGDCWIGEVPQLVEERLRMFQGQVIKVLPHAEYIARVAYREILSGKTCAEVEPLYVRAPDAKPMMEKCL